MDLRYALSLPRAAVHPLAPVPHLPHPIPTHPLETDRRSHDVAGEALANAVADSIENDIAAGNSWQVILKNDGKVEWITVVDGVVTAEADTEPMTSAARRAEAKALALVPDDAEL